MEQVLQWLALVIEFFGLSMIALELYAPNVTARLVEVLEGKSPTEPGERRLFSVGLLITLFILAWIAFGIAVSIYDPKLNLAFNLIMVVVTIAGAAIAWALSKLIQMGIAIGRGNTIGGIGLVLALAGFALEYSQLT